MAAHKSHFRHLPPTAVPLTGSDLSKGLRPPEKILDSFRGSLAAYLGVQPKALKLASSGRTALYCLLHGLKLTNPSRTQIIMPAYTCPAVARVAIDLEIEPVYVDLSPATMDYDYEQLAANMSEITLAIVVVHPFGIPLPVEDAIAVAKEFGAVVIEDAAQSMGARWHGQPAGTSADFGLYSLGPGKPISTGGGGLAVANQSEGLEVLQRGWRGLPAAGSLASFQAWVRQAAFHLVFHPRGWWAATQVGLHRVGSHEASWGYKLTGLTPAQAAVGQELLPRLDEINNCRRQKANLLAKAVENSTNLSTPVYSHHAEPIYLRFPIIARDKQQREALYEQFWSQGIGAGRLYEETLPHIFNHQKEGAYPGAERIAGCLLTLPTHHYVMDNDLQAMCTILAST